jgi:hypothetical protein
MQSDIVPMLTYENELAAMDWLCRVFGFTEKTKWLGAVPYIINGVFVCVDDIQKHYENARKLGALILSELEFGEPGTR